MCQRMALEAFPQRCTVMLTTGIFSLWALLHLLSCGWNVANNLAREHVPHFTALPSKVKTTLMAISCEGSGSIMDFSAGIFISLGISVSKTGTE